MDKFEYRPATFGAHVVKMDGPSGFVGTAENVRSREWAHELGKRNVVSAVRSAREVEVDFACDFETMDRLREAADADMYNRTPGTFVAQGEWKQRGYITASEPQSIHFGHLRTKLSAVLLDGAWWRVRGISLLPPPSDPAGKQYATGTGERVRTEGAADEGLHALTIYGKSVQDGTPTPSSPVAVQVVEAPNLFSLVSASTTIRNVEFTVGDGSVTANGKATGGNTTLSIGTVDLGAGTYAISGISGGSGTTYAIRLSISGTTLKYVYGTDTFTLDSASTVTLQFYVYNNYDAQNVTIQPQIEKGATATPYVPYGCIGLNCGTAQTPIDLQGNVLASLPDGTRDELSIDSTGAVTLTKRVGVADMSTMGFTKSADGPNCASMNATTGIGYPSGKIDELVSNEYHKGIYASRTENGNMFRSGNWLVITNTACTTTGEFTTALANAVLYYPLATPQTITLDPITMPDTSDGGTVEIVAAVTPTITAEWELAQHINLDYPHDYAHDYSAPTTGGMIDTGSLVPCRPRLVFYGPITNPYIIVAGNKYQVDGSVAAGARIEVDGKYKTVRKIAEDGTVTDKFADAHRGSGEGGGEYIFQPIPAGEHSVTWDGTFGVDVGWYDEVGEPPWNQS